MPLIHEGRDAESFAASWAMKRATQHALLIVAEAAKRQIYFPAILPSTSVFAVPILRR